jgi:hypothetical protein
MQSSFTIYRQNEWLILDFDIDLSRFDNENSIDLKNSKMELADNY